MAGPALQTLHKLVENWNLGDFDAVFATFDEAIVVRPDPKFPEGVFFGKAAAQGFWESQRDLMGLGELVIEGEQDLGDRAVARIIQPVHSRSGIESAYGYSILITQRFGRLILIEFFIDEALAKAALGA